MPGKAQFFINGKWLHSDSREVLKLINPANEICHDQLQLGNETDVNKAVSAAKNAFPRFAALPLVDRIRLLQRISDGYKARFADIGASISKEMGAPIKFAERFQAGAGHSHFKQILKLLETYKFDVDMNKTRVVREPIGVCGMIVPWNWPMNQITCKLAPALAAGCTIVLKPSELTPGSAIILAEILEEAGVPSGVFNMVQGLGPVVGDAIARHPDVDMISFTGSTQGGIAVARAAAPTVKRIGQELGGKAANILLDDVDFEDAVNRGVNLCFRNSGQSCNSPARLLVPNHRLDEAAKIAKRVAEGIKIGDPGLEETVMGPVVSEKQWTKIQKYIRSGLDEGAKLIAGGLGKPYSLSIGYYIKPTIFSHVSPSMTIAREEIFGPVLCIIGFDTDAEAIEIANDSPFGLAAYVESSDINRAKKVALKVRAGMVHLNGAVADPAAPFGGYRQSGNGREWGLHGLEEFTELKAIMGYRQN